MPLNGVKTRLRAKANNFAERLHMRARTVYEDECINLEAHFNVAKDAIKDTAPAIVATGLGKIISSFRRTQFRTPTPAKTNHRGDDRGRIDKQKRFTPSLPDMGKLEEEARAKYEERQRLKRVAQEQETRLRAAEARAASKKSAEPRRRLPPPEPVVEQSYMSTLGPDLAPVEPIARAKFIHEKLAFIVGEERMNMGVGLPSGDSGIDPVIAEYNQQKAAADLWDQIHAFRAEERRKAEEQQRLLAQEEEERQRIQVLLQVARARYEDNMQDLVQYGPDISTGIDMLDIAIRNNYIDDMPYIVRVLTVEIFEPAHALFKKMDDNIPLEEEGAQLLKETWPMKRLEEVYDFLKNENELPAELSYLGQGIETVCKRILNPTPFVNPLDPKPVPVSRLQLPAVGIQLAPNNGSYPVPAPLAPAAGIVPAPLAPAADPIPAPTNDGPNFNSFADFAAASKAAQGNQQAAQGNQQAPGIKITPPTPDSKEKQDIFLHMQSTLFELQMNVQDLLKGDSLPNLPRQDVTTALKQLVDLANGQKQILGDGEGDLYKEEIKRIRRRIGNLNRTAKNVTKTRQLDVLANSALKLWISDL